MATVAGRRAPSAPPAAAQPVVAEARRVVPVKWWAGLGALIVAFIAFVLIRWVTGPFFEEVPSGPSDPPTYMKVAIVTFQALCIPVALFCIYWFVVRPWRRERNIGVDGVLVIAFSTLWFQDPLSAYAGHWFTYNSWAINFGSWVNSVPGWLSFGEPGAMVVEPLLIIPGVYVWVFVLTMMLGTWVMRTAKQRWPRMGKLGLAGICFLAMCAFDVVFEGIVFLPLGVWEYPGGHVPIVFGDTYHRFPLNEMITVSALFTAVACLRYFVNDRGEMIVERGIDRVQGGPGKKVVLRALATIAACHLALILAYNVPNTWIGMHSTEWPADLQKRSYLTDYLCGDGTDRACPGPAVPLVRNDNGNPRGGSAYLGLDGQLVVPPDTEIPAPVPFDRGASGGG